MKSNILEEKQSNRSGRENLYRKELKYVVNTAQLAILRSRLKPLTKQDTHAAESGRYSIRSLYFDDWRNRCYFENRNGISPREKFRIRIYNGECEPAFLELKRKVNGLTQKKSVRLRLGGTAWQLLSPKEWGSPQFFDGQIISNHSLISQFILQCQKDLLSPKIIVEYDREVFLYPSGNVRITFDTNIRSCSSLSQFLNHRIETRPVMPSGQHILEVKYDEFLPDFLKEMMELEELRLTAFSKYFICRNYDLSEVPYGWF